MNLLYYLNKHEIPNQIPCKLRTENTAKKSSDKKNFLTTKYMEFFKWVIKFVLKNFKSTKNNFNIEENITKEIIQID